jgi:hypothetical protein
MTYGIIFWGNSPYSIKHLGFRKRYKNYDGFEKKGFMQGFIQRNENSACMFSIHIFPDAICCK